MPIAPQSSDPNRLFAEVSDSLRSWIRLPNEEAGDIVQEAWKEALRYGPDLWSLGPAALFVYLRKCAVTAIGRRARKTSDALRHVAARLAEEANAEGDAGGVPTLHRVGDDPMALVTDSDRAVLLQRAVAQLNPEQRLRLTLSFTYDLSSVEIGRILGCSASSVDNSNSRAYERLRALLPSEAHLGGDAERATGTLWFPGGRSVAFEVSRCEVRALAAGACLFVELRAAMSDHDPGADAGTLSVPECWAIVHPTHGPISSPVRALWTTVGNRRAATMQMPEVSGARDGLKHVFVFAGPLPGA